MLSSRTITDLISQPPSPMLGGKVAFHSRQMRGRMGSLNGPESHARFLDELERQSQDAKPAQPQYDHPEKDPLARPVKPSEGLTPADLMWLGRLPADPEKVSHSDAVALAGLNFGVSKMTNPSDARLIRSMWDPVKEVHDARAAQVALANAQTSVPDAPSSTVSALADALRAEVPQLRPEEAVSRAGVQVSEALTKRRAAREQRVLDAHAAITAASEAAARRTSVTRA